MNLDFIEVVRTKYGRALRWACDSGGVDIKNLMDAAWRLIISGVLTPMMRDMVSNNATNKEFKRSYELRTEYVEIKLLTTYLNVNIYQGEIGAGAQQRNKCWK